MPCNLLFQGVFQAREPYRGWHEALSTILFSVVVQWIGYQDGYGPNKDDGNLNQVSDMSTCMLGHSFYTPLILDFGKTHQQNQQLRISAK
jgi:hypothetical protein